VRTSDEKPGASVFTVYSPGGNSELIGADRVRGRGLGQTRSGVRGSDLRTRNHRSAGIAHRAAQPGVGQLAPGGRRGEGKEKND